MEEDDTQQTDSADCLNEEEKRGTDTTVVGGAVSSVNDCSWFTAFFPTSGERTEERTRTPVGEARETKREREKGIVVFVTHASTHAGTSLRFNRGHRPSIAASLRQTLAITPR